MHLSKFSLPYFVFERNPMTFRTSIDILPEPIFPLIVAAIRFVHLTRGSGGFHLFPPGFARRKAFPLIPLSSSDLSLLFTVFCHNEII
jgi:hypothetical protein